jgi:hypothetical protein
MSACRSRRLQSNQLISEYLLLSPHTGVVDFEVGM